MKIYEYVYTFNAKKLKYCMNDFNTRQKKSLTL